MAMLLCLIVIYVLLLLNDLLESDKVGPFFLIALAIIVNVDLRNQALARASESQPEEEP